MSMQYSKADLLDRLRFLSKVLGRTPTQAELAAPAGRTYVPRFGSYEAAREEAGLPEPRVRFRRIQKRGCMIFLHEYAVRRRLYLRRLHNMLLTTLGNGHSIIKDSFFVGSAESEGAIFVDAPRAKIRMLTIYLGKRKVRTVPQFPMSHAELMSCGYDVRPALGLGVCVEKVHQIVSAATDEVAAEQLAERLSKQMSKKLDSLVPSLRN